MNGLRDYRVLSLFTKHISHFNIFYCVVIVFFLQSGSCTFFSCKLPHNFAIKN